MMAHHRQQVFGEIMTLLCPHCNKPVLDRRGINAFPLIMKHSSDSMHGCDHYFCGSCHVKCENKHDCNLHVLRCCPDIAHTDYDSVHAKRRRNLILQYLQWNISDDEERRRVHMAVREELSDCGVYIGKP